MASRDVKKCHFLQTCFIIDSLVTPQFLASNFFCCAFTSPTQSVTSYLALPFSKNTMTSSSAAWWKETVVYQIYPRSFQDSSGNGVGDLKGLIQRLDYIAELGVETLWLNPIFQSPNDDNGYDVSDYRDIMGEFGSMEDFDSLLTEMKKRKLRLVLDLVPNHSSDEHKWFKEARKSKDNPYRDYYYWKAPGEDCKPPSNWVSFFAPSAWELDEATNEYYLHIFSKKQPDLNWENPKVRQEIYDIMHFWMKKGIDGFRIDVLPFISKNLQFPDQTSANFNGNLGDFYSNGPRLHEFIQELNSAVLSEYPEMFTVAEGPGISPEVARLYTAEDRHELHSLYHFDHMDLDKDSENYNFFEKPKPVSIVKFKYIVSNWDTLIENGGWYAAFLGNHDFPRIVSRFGDDGKYRVQAAKLLALFLLTQRATPFLYFGDEIGMTNVPWNTLDKYRDLQVFDGYQKHLTAGGDAQEFLNNLRYTSRDNARTPMQWNAGQHAGFTTGEPWIDVNPNYNSINVEAEQQNPNSILNFYKEAIQFRRKYGSELVYGSFKDLLPEHPALFIYERNAGTGSGGDNSATSFMVLLNMSGESQQVPDEVHGRCGKCELHSYLDEPSPTTLRPWEAAIYLE